MSEGVETSFSGATKRRLVDDFALAFFNGSLKPNLAEKNPMNGREVEYLMDGPQFDRIPKKEIWSSSSAVGTGYQFKVVYKDKRFSDLEDLLAVYSGTAPTSDEDRPVVEQRLYEFIMLLMKEGRLPKTFKIQSTGEADTAKVVASIDELRRSLDDLGRRVRRLEEQLASRGAQGTLDESPQ